MLDNLIIRNYRNLKDFAIPYLGRVNLITGKNNTGKSTILEAVALYASQGDVSLIYDLLEERGENYYQEGVKNPVEMQLKSLECMFPERKRGFVPEQEIIIGPESQTMTMGLVKFQRDFDGVRILQSEPATGSQKVQLGFVVRVGNDFDVLELDGRPYHSFSSKDKSVFQFVRSMNMDRGRNELLWDQIILTDKETIVVEALRLIEPEVERVAFVQEASANRVALIKLSGRSGVVPLKSMGDGINRVFTMILALVNADKGFLLIDEFENGLHYSTQQLLWEIIFRFSKQLGVQVFATTHSEDCISSFGQVLNTIGNETAGKLIRLEYKNGRIAQVEYDADELKIATEQNIETR